MKNLQEKLDLAQKGCSARTISVSDVTEAIKKAENKLADLLIPKKAWLGCKIIIEPEKVCNSYSYRADGTEVIIIRKKSCWSLLSVNRVYVKKCAHGAPKQTKLVLSDTAVAAMPKTILCY